MNIVKQFLTLLYLSISNILNIQYQYCFIKKKNTSLLDSTPRIFSTSPLYTALYYFQSPILIIDNIYLGNMYCAINKENLKKLEINYIVNCTKDIPNFYNDINYYRVNIDDDGEEILDLNIIEGAIKFIKESQSVQSISCKNTNILVHCAAGRSRSVSIIIIYLIHKYNYTPVEALSYIKGKKSHINPSKKLFDNCNYYYNNINF